MVTTLIKHKWLTLIFFILAFILIFIPEVFFILYGSVLLATLLYSLSAFLIKKFHFGFNGALTIVIVFLVLLFGITIFIIYPSLDKELGEFAKTIPTTIEKNIAYLETTSWGENLAKELKDGKNITKFLPTEFLPKTANFIASTIGVIATSGFMLVIGFYSALNARKYSYFFNFVSSHEQKDLILKIFSNTQKWLFGKFLSMLVIGILTYIGLIILDVKAAFALALIAGFLSFIPNLGPILSFIPAMLMAMATSFDLVLYTAIVFMLVQMLEGTLITPNIERKTISLLPSITMAFQLFMAALYGIYGLFFASPILVIFATIIRERFPEKAFNPPEDEETIELGN